MSDFAALFVFLRGDRVEAGLQTCRDFTVLLVVFFFFFLQVEVETFQLPPRQLLPLSGGGVRSEDAERAILER